jgi:F-type H+-transporting ATPase subunit c
MKRTAILVLALFASLSLSSLALAADTAAAATEGKTVAEQLALVIPLAAGFGIAIAVFGGALSQAYAVRSALDGIARNPGASGKIMTPMIIGLAFIESLVIYALLIAFMLMGKI